MHWAVEYIGKPYAADGAGPAAFSCWGLVRYVFKQEHGIDLPFIAVGQADVDNVRAIKSVIEIAGIRQVDRLPRDGEIVVLHTPLELHCGLAAVANGKLGLLDSTRLRGVRWHTWKDVVDCPFDIWGWP